MIDSHACVGYKVSIYLFCSSPRETNAAFSLVELSIVLVILGLLTGGILAGQSLIRAAELRAVSTEYSRYVTATQSFRDKYFALPGDMTNATVFWGPSANCPGSSSQGTTDGTTCNGDGNGLVDFRGPYTSPTANETLRYWQHLGSAGLIEGQYNGVTADASGYYFGVSAANSPKSKLSNGYWSIFQGDNTAGAFAGGMFNIRYINNFLLGGLSGTSWNSTPLLKPEEAWNIDTKIDDGKPGTGKIISSWGGNCTDATSGAVLTAFYALTQNGTNCILAMQY